MGPKVTIDSATLMNKALELIEAHHLFSIDADRLDVLIHPQSIVHCLVYYRDGSVLAQMSCPDMRTPIAYSLAWPNRMQAPTARLDLASIGALAFEAPDEARFPALRLARDVLAAGGSASTVLNAANEIAVEAFLDGRIGFLAIGRLVESTLDRSAHLVGLSPDSVDDVLTIDAEARAIALSLLAVCTAGRGALGSLGIWDNLWNTILKLSGFGDTVLSYLLPFLFVLTIVVFFHELGHFLVARWCGVAVKTFSIGFGPEIVGFNDRHGTRWRLSWIPLGGYVKFIDDENAASAGQRPLEGMTEEERKHSFQGKSLGARAAIVAAGPIANFLLAIVIFTAIFTFFGERSTAAKVDIVNPGSAAESAGFQARRPRGQDRWLDHRELRTDAAHRRHEPEQELHFSVEREGRPVELDGHA